LQTSTQAPFTQSPTAQVPSLHPWQIAGKTQSAAVLHAGFGGGGHATPH
jgi:hypothetical protein